MPVALALLDSNGNLCDRNWVMSKPILYLLNTCMYRFFSCTCSTMTKLLDLLEVYLQNRVLPNGKAMGYR
jgi:hypothetical protein